LDGKFFELRQIHYSLLDPFMTAQLFLGG